MSVFTVTCDDAGLTLTDPSGAALAVTWAALTRVEVITTDEGPLEDDVFWLFFTDGGEPTLIYPGGTDGDGEALEAMQARLPGFDSAAVIAAMSSTDNARFILWTRD